MASDSEASCVSDPNFAVICSFLEKFGASCGITSPDFLQLQEMLENTQELSQELIDIHLKLLRRIKRSVSADRWERVLIKVCHTYCSQDAWELERFGYKKARLSSKLRILKQLLEMQFDFHQKFKTEVNRLTASELRTQPIGRDKHGHAYWYQIDEHCQMRVYREDPDEETWMLVANNREGLVRLISQLASDDPNLADLVLNEDSNSLEIEKPILDTGQTSSSTSNCEAEADESSGGNDVSSEPQTETSPVETSAETSTTENTTPAEEKPKIESQPKVNKLKITLSSSTTTTHKPEQLSEDPKANVITTVKNEEKMKSEDKPEKPVGIKLSVPQTSIPITTKGVDLTSKRKKSINDLAVNLRLKNRDLLYKNPVQEQEMDLSVKKPRMDPKQFSSLSVPPFEPMSIESALRMSDDFADDEEMEDEDEDEDEFYDEDEISLPSHMKQPRLDRPTLLGNAKKKTYSDEEDDEEYGEEIEEPIMLIHGEGSGRDCENENIRVNMSEDYSEAVEEPVMYFYGEGSGFECDTGNTGKEEDTSSDKKSSDIKDSASSKVVKSNTNESDLNTIKDNESASNSSSEVLSVVGEQKTDKNVMDDDSKDDKSDSLANKSKHTSPKCQKIGTIMIDVKSGNRGQTSPKKISRWDIGKPVETCSIQKEKNIDYSTEKELCNDSTNSSIKINENSDLNPLSTSKDETDNIISDINVTDIETSVNKLKDCEKEEVRLINSEAADTAVNTQEALTDHKTNESDEKKKQSMFFFGPGCFQFKAPQIPSSKIKDLNIKGTDAAHNYSIKIQNINDQANKIKTETLSSLSDRVPTQINKAEILINKEQNMVSKINISSNITAVHDTKKMDDIIKENVSEKESCDETTKISEVNEKTCNLDSDLQSIDNNEPLPTENVEHNDIEICKSSNNSSSVFLKSQKEILNSVEVDNFDLSCDKISIEKENITLNPEISHSENKSTKLLEINVESLSSKQDKKYIPESIIHPLVNDDNKQDDMEIENVTLKKDYEMCTTDSRKSVKNDNINTTFDLTKNIDVNLKKEKEATEATEIIQQKDTLSTEEHSATEIRKQTSVNVPETNASHNIDTVLPTNIDSHKTTDTFKTETNERVDIEKTEVIRTDSEKITEVCDNEFKGNQVETSEKEGVAAEKRSESLTSANETEEMTDDKSETLSETLDSLTTLIDNKSDESDDQSTIKNDQSSTVHNVQISDTNLNPIDKECSENDAVTTKENKTVSMEEQNSTIEEKISVLEESNQVTSNTENETVTSVDEMIVTTDNTILKFAKYKNESEEETSEENNKVLQTKQDTTIKDKTLESPEVGKENSSKSEVVISESTEDEITSTVEISNEKEKCDEKNIEDLPHKITSTEENSEASSSANNEEINKDLDTTAATVGSSLESENSTEISETVKHQETDSNTIVENITKLDIDEAKENITVNVENVSSDNVSEYNVVSTSDVDIAKSFYDINKPVDNKLNFVKSDDSVLNREKKLKEPDSETIQSTSIDNQAPLSVTGELKEIVEHNTISPESGSNDVEKLSTLKGEVIITVPASESEIQDNNTVTPDESKIDVAPTSESKDVEELPTKALITDPTSKMQENSAALVDASIIDVIPETKSTEDTNTNSTTESQMQVCNSGTKDESKTGVTSECELKEVENTPTIKEEATVSTSDPKMQENNAVTADESTINVPSVSESKDVKYIPTVVTIISDPVSESEMQKNNVVVTDKSVKDVTSVSNIKNVPMVTTIITNPANESAKQEMNADELIKDVTPVPDSKNIPADTKITDPVNESEIQESNAVAADEPMIDVEQISESKDVENVPTEVSISDAASEFEILENNAVAANESTIGETPVLESKPVENVSTDTKLTDPVNESEMQENNEVVANKSVKDVENMPTKAKITNPATESEKQENNSVTVNESMDVTPVSESKDLSTETEIISDSASKSDKQKNNADAADEPVSESKDDENLSTETTIISDSTCKSDKQKYNVDAADEPVSESKDVENLSTETTIISDFVSKSNKQKNNADAAVEPVSEAKDVENIPTDTRITDPANVSEMQENNAVAADESMIDLTAVPESKEVNNLTMEATISDSASEPDKQESNAVTTDLPMKDETTVSESKDVENIPTDTTKSDSANESDKQENVVAADEPIIDVSPVSEPKDVENVPIETTIHDPSTKSNKQESSALATDLPTKYETTVSESKDVENIPTDTTKNSDYVNESDKQENVVAADEPMVDVIPVSKDSENVPVVSTIIDTASEPNKQENNAIAADESMIDVTAVSEPKDVKNVHKETTINDPNKQESNAVAAIKDLTPVSKSKDVKNTLTEATSESEKQENNAATADESKIDVTPVLKDAVNVPTEAKITKVQDSSAVTAGEQTIDVTEKTKSSNTETGENVESVDSASVSVSQENKKDKPETTAEETTVPNTEFKKESPKLKTSKGEETENKILKSSANKSLAIVNNVENDNVAKSFNTDSQSDSKIDEMQESSKEINEAKSLGEENIDSKSSIETKAKKTAVVTDCISDQIKLDTDKETVDPIINKNEEIEINEISSKKTVEMQNSIENITDTSQIKENITKIAKTVPEVKEKNSQHKNFNVSSVKDSDNNEFKTKQIKVPEKEISKSSKHLTVSSEELHDMKKTINSENEPTETTKHENPEKILKLREEEKISNIKDSNIDLTLHTSADNIKQDGSILKVPILNETEDSIHNIKEFNKDTKNNLQLVETNYITAENSIECLKASIAKIGQCTLEVRKPNITKQDMKKQNTDKPVLEKLTDVVQKKIGKDTIDKNSESMQATKGNKITEPNVKKVIQDKKNIGNTTENPEKSVAKTSNNYHEGETIKQITDVKEKSKSDSVFDKLTEVSDKLTVAGSAQSDNKKIQRGIRSNVKGIHSNETDKDSSDDDMMDSCDFDQGNECNDDSDNEEKDNISKTIAVNEEKLKHTEINIQGTKNKIMLKDINTLIDDKHKMLNNPSKSKIIVNTTGIEKKKPVNDTYDNISKMSTKSKKLQKSDLVDDLKKEKTDEKITDKVLPKKSKMKLRDVKENKKVPILTCVDITKLQAKSVPKLENKIIANLKQKSSVSSPKSLESIGVENEDSCDVIDIPETDPLALAEEEILMSKKLEEEAVKNKTQGLSLAAFKLDDTEETDTSALIPEPIARALRNRKISVEVVKNVTRKRSSDGAVVDSSGGKKRRGRGRPRANVGNRVIEIKDNSSSEEENESLLERAAVKITTPQRGTGKARRGRGRGRGRGSAQTHIERVVNDSPVLSSDAQSESSRAEVTASPMVQKTPTGRRKRRVLGLDIDPNVIIQPEGTNKDSEEPTTRSSVRQSRRIAQIKIKEQAERRKIEEITHVEVEHRKKKKKDDDKDFRIDKKKKKPKAMSEDDEDSEEVVEISSKRKHKKRRHQDLRKLFNTSNPWQSSSESSSNEEQEEEEFEEEPSDEEPAVLKSDHEFSPESDLENNAEIQPLRRARTVKKESDTEEPTDEHACQKCGKADHPEWILLCDKCDCGWHCSCLRPALLVIPEGDWFCPPCQHITLIEALKAQLIDYDKKFNRREMEVRRKQRLAYVGISLDNVLPSKESEGPKTEPDNDQDEGASGDESSESESGSESGSSSGDESEPIYQLRQRRQAHSYRFNDYDELINSAIQDEMESVKGAGNQGRGKDIATIVNAEKEEAKALLEQQQNVQEPEVEQPPPVVPILKEKSEREPEASEDSSEDDRPRVVPKHSGRKKHRKLNSLDISSEDDADDDEDFKGTSASEEEDIEDLGSEDSELDYRRGRGRSGPTRRSTRARMTRFDKDFINDDSEDEAPKRKKTKSIWDESESEESDKSWGRRKKSKKQRQFPTPKSSKKSRKKKRRSNDSDPDVRKPKKPKIKYGGLEDSDDEEFQTRRTRGRKINYIDALGSDSDEDKKRKTVKPIESEDEYVANEEDEDIEEAEAMGAVEDEEKDSDSDSVDEKPPLQRKIIKIIAPSKVAKGRGKAGIPRPEHLKQVTPPVIPQPEPEPEPEPMAKTPEDVENEEEVEEEDEEEEEESEPPVPVDIPVIAANPDNLDEEEVETMMMENEEYAKKQLELMAIQLAKEKKKKEIEAKKVAEKKEVLISPVAATFPAISPPTQPKKRGRKSKSELEAIAAAKAAQEALSVSPVTMNPALVQSPDSANKIIPPNTDLNIPSAEMPAIVPTVVSDLSNSPPKRRGRGKGKKTLAAQAAASVGESPPKTTESQPPPPEIVTAPVIIPPPASVINSTTSPLNLNTMPNINIPTSTQNEQNLSPNSNLHAGKLGIAAPPQPFSQNQPTPSVITRMLQSQPMSAQTFTTSANAMNQKYFPPGMPPEQQPPRGSPTGQFPPIAGRGRVPSPYRQSPPAMGMYPGVRPMAPNSPHRLRSPGPSNIQMFHSTHHSMDPSPSGGGPINIAPPNRDRNSPGNVGSPMTPKEGPTPPPPPYSRAMTVNRFSPNESSPGPSLPPPIRHHMFPQATAHMQQPSPPPRPPPSGNFSPYHPPPPPNYHYGAYPPAPSLAAADDALPPTDYQGSPYPEQYNTAEGTVHSSEGSNSKPFDEEGSGEFGGLVSYFSSQREDDLDT